MKQSQSAAGVRGVQASPLWPPAFMVITPNVINYLDNDALMFKKAPLTFYSPRSVFQGPHVLHQPRPVSHSCRHSTFTHTWTMQPAPHSWPLGRRGGEDSPVRQQLGETMTLTCLLALLSPCITEKARSNSTIESADTCLQVRAAAELNEINTSTPFLRLAAAGSYYGTSLQCRTDYEADVRSQSAVLWQSADTVNPQPSFWNCYGKQRKQRAS